MRSKANLPDKTQIRFKQKGYIIFMRDYWKKNDLPELLFYIGGLVLCFYIIFFPPVHGIADQGDFERVMNPAGLNFFDLSTHNFYEFAEPFYKMEFLYPWAKKLYPLSLLGIIPATSQIYPIALAKLLCRLFFLPYFDTRVLAAVFCLAYLLVCGRLLRCVPIRNFWVKLGFGAGLLFIFFDGSNITTFNSLYGQSMILLSAALFLLSCVLLIQNRETPSRRYLILFFLSCVFLLGSKLQCSVFLPFFLLIYLLLLKKGYPKKLTVFLMLFTLWYGAGNYLLNGSALNEDTQYNSVFYGILADSADPEQDLKDLGLSPKLAADAGKHAYLEPSQYVYPPHTPELKTEFYDKMNNGKLLFFYLTHPGRLVNAMEKTAQNAFHTTIDLGTFEKSTGIKKSEYRFTLWSTLRNSFPKTLWFIVPCYGLFFAFGFYEGWKRKNPYGWLFLLILIMGLIQFPMPYLGNGNADIPKQLYFFNLSFDLGIFTGIWYLIYRMKFYLKK